MSAPGSYPLQLPVVTVAMPVDRARAVYDLLTRAEAHDQQTQDHYAAAAGDLWWASIVLRPEREAMQRGVRSTWNLMPGAFDGRHGSSIKLMLESFGWGIEERRDRDTGQVVEYHVTPPEFC